LAAPCLRDKRCGDRLISELVFHFKDGSVDDEITIFSQRDHFRLLSSHHVQKGPAFPHPMDVSIDGSTGEVRVRSTENGKDKVQTKHLDLPPDLANGLIFTILKNIRPDTPETKLSYLVLTSSSDALCREGGAWRRRRSRGAAHWQAATRHARVDSWRESSGIRENGGTTIPGRSDLENRADEPGVATIATLREPIPAPCSSWLDVGRRSSPSMKLIASAAWGNVVHDRNSEIFNWHINKRCFVFGTARLCLSLGFPVPVDWYCKSKSHNEPSTDLFLRSK